MTRTSYPHIERLLLRRMNREKALQLDDYLSRNFPSPRWVESLLESLDAVPTLDNALKPIRKDPSQTIRYCSNLSIGRYYASKGLDIEFLDTLDKRNFDIRIDQTFAVEIKLLDDVSNWTPLSQRVLTIRSDYLVVIATDREIGSRQVDGIIADIENAVANHSEDQFEVQSPRARLSFLKASRSGKTLPIVESGVFGINVQDLKRLFVSRIEDARDQLERSLLIKVVAIDVNRSDFFRELLDDIFCGTQTDGVANAPHIFDVVDAILVFHGQDHIAHYWRPGTPSFGPLLKLGTPRTCTS